jgi:hypothetical protein
LCLQDQDYRMLTVGEVAEWLNVPHSKCGVGLNLSRVRIPPSPPKNSKALLIKAGLFVVR